MTQEQACQLLGKLAEFWPQWHVAKMLAAHLSDAKAETEPGLLKEWVRTLEKLPNYEIAEQAARHVWDTTNSYPTPARIRDAYCDIAPRRRDEGALGETTPSGPEVSTGFDEIRRELAALPDAERTDLLAKAKASVQPPFDRYEKCVLARARQLLDARSPDAKAEAAPEGMGAWVRRKLAEVKP